MEAPSAGYGWGMQVAHRFVIAASAIVLLSGCFAESGLQDEFRDATQALDQLVDEIENEGPVREAAERAQEAVDEAEAALEDFREDPSAETRQALEQAKQRLDDAAAELERVTDQAPDALRAVLDALTELRNNIERELEQEE
jgi:ABC-type transporter Mla subunit MlaD